MPQKNKYEQLTEDLRKALEIGEKAEAMDPDDGGTCNFDSPRIRLPRWTEKKVQEAAKAAGTSCFKWNLYGSISYVFAIHTGGQGDARTRNAEAVAEALKGMGYDADMYYAMD